MASRKKMFFTIAYLLILWYDVFIDIRLCVGANQSEHR
jgi:hypothetical protein